MNTVTYIFADGTKQSQSVNKEALNHHKGGMIELFKQTASDRNAITFSVDADKDFQIEKESVKHFTSEERKKAKQDYKDFQKFNLQYFNKERDKFRAELVDKLSNKLRFNLTNLSTLN